MPAMQPKCCQQEVFGAHCQCLETQVLLTARMLTVLLGLKTDSETVGDSDITIPKLFGSV